MGRIIAIDFGLKRTGLAWTDPLKIISTGIGTVETGTLLEKLKSLVKNESIERFVLGMPSLLGKQETDTSEPIRVLKAKMEQEWPEIPVDFWDESHSSVNAKKAMLAGGLSKTKRKNKSLIDEVAATLILQDYMNFRL